MHRQLGRAQALTVLALLLSATLVSACKPAQQTDAPADERASAPPPPSDSAPMLPERREVVDGVEIVLAAGPEPTADTVLASGGDIEVTLADYRVALKRSLLFAPRAEGGSFPDEVPRVRLADPRAQLSLVRGLLTKRVVAQEAQRRGLQATRAQKRAALSTHPRLAGFADLLAAEPQSPPVEWAESGLTLADLDQVAEDAVLHDALREALIDEVDEETLWRAFQARRNTMALALGWVRNTPSSATIDAFLSEDEGRQWETIRAHFEKNKRQYRRPPMVEAIILRAERGARVSEQTLKQAKDRLESAEDADAIAQALGLVVEPRARMVRQENPRAFSAPPGSSGYTMKGPRGAYAWRVLGSLEAKTPELDGSLRRQIAAEILRDRGVVPTAAAKLTKLRRAMSLASVDEAGRLTAAAIDELEATAASLGLTFKVTEPFPLTPNGFVPGVGLAPEVTLAAAERALEDPLGARPILSRAKAYIFRLQDRHVPTRAEFKEQREAFEPRYLAEQKRRVVDIFVARWEDEHGVELNLKPLRVEYGVAEKPAGVAAGQPAPVR